MKKQLLSLSVIIMAAVALTGCSSSSDEPQKPAAGNEQSTETRQETDSEEPHEVPDFTFSADNIDAKAAADLAAGTYEAAFNRDEFSLYKRDNDNSSWQWLDGEDWTGGPAKYAYTSFYFHKGQILYPEDLDVLCADNVGDITVLFNTWKKYLKETHQDIMLLYAQDYSYQPSTGVLTVGKDTSRTILKLSGTDLRMSISMNLTWGDYLTDNYCSSTDMPDLDSDNAKKFESRNDIIGYICDVLEEQYPDNGDLAETIRHIRENYNLSGVCDPVAD